MAKRKSFSDDGWAMWVTGDDSSTFYLNHWINPSGSNFVDLAVRIRKVRSTHDLNIYIPYSIEASEVEDISFRLQDPSVFRAVFSTRCIMDVKKNRCTSELAYHGKTVDLIHISCTDYTLTPIASGTLLTMSLDSIMDCLDNNEAYLMFRLPHKNLDLVLRPQIDLQTVFDRLMDLITTPVVSEKYTCSVRINEVRLLPDEVNLIGAFHRQKLNKTVVTVSIHEDYQVNDSGCFRVHRLEQDLYGNFAPEGFDCEDAITYEWIDSRERNPYGRYNYYFGISRDSISKRSMLLYIVILLFVGFIGEALYNWMGL